jgi:predicted cobalt transporter CbtA
MISHILKTILSFALWLLATVLIKHGSSSAFELGLFLGFMGFAHWIFWPEKKEGVSDE